MKKTALKQTGPKAREWQKARRTLIKNLDPRKYHVIGTVVHGPCEDCGHYKVLTADHLIKRSAGGSHEVENIGWVCLTCHDKRDNMGDPENKKPTGTGKSKKAAWEVEHSCKNCKRKTSMLICNFCHQMSVSL